MVMERERECVLDTTTEEQTLFYVVARGRGRMNRIESGDTRGR